MTSFGSYVFAFTDRRPEVAAFYRDVLGLPVQEETDDAVWFGPEGARFAVHDDDDRETAPDVAAGRGFVVSVSVEDLDAAYERAHAAGALVGERYGEGAREAREGRPYERSEYRSTRPGAAQASWFFVRDPEGRFLIVGPRPRQ